MPFLTNSLPPEGYVTARVYDQVLITLPGFLFIHLSEKRSMQYLKVPGPVRYMTKNFHHVQASTPTDQALGFSGLSRIGELVSTAVPRRRTKPHGLVH